MGSNFHPSASFTSWLFVAFVVVAKKDSSNVQCTGLDVYYPSTGRRCCLCF